MANIKTLLNCGIVLLAAVRLVFAQSQPSYIVWGSGATCHTYSNSNGHSIWCGGLGNCIDGTIVKQPGQCQNFTDMCYDLPTMPSCLRTQTMSKSLVSDWISAGLGTCDSFGTTDWTRHNWTWSCCDCPPGYVDTNFGRCVVNMPGVPHLSGNCVGCLGANEILTGDPVSGFKCSPASTSSSSTTHSSSSSSISSARSSSSCSLLSSTSTSSRAHEATYTPMDCSKVVAHVGACGPACKGTDLTQQSCATLTTPAGTCNIDQTGLNQIKNWECCCSKVYEDPLGIETVGCGHNCQAHRDCDTYKKGIDICKAEEMLRKDVNGARRSVISNIVKPLAKKKIHIGSNMFDALISLAYNCGSYANSKTIWFADGGNPLLQAVEDGNLFHICQSFGTGLCTGPVGESNVRAGLEARRLQEGCMCMNDLELGCDEKTYVLKSTATSVTC